jgi:hypothetical protein
MACGSPRGGGGGGIDFGDGAAPADSAATADQPVGATPDAPATTDTGGGGDPCAAFCARAASAGCPAFDAAACAGSCQMVLGLARCRTQAEAAYSCGATATVTCDEDGDATSSDCAASLGALTACLGVMR